MKITLAGYVLADFAAGIFAQSKSLNGQVLADPVDLVRASQRRYYPRGNAATTYQVTTWRTFDSLADAQDYFYGVRTLAPVSGALVVQQIGALAGRPPATMERAVLAGVSPTLMGRTVAVDWTLVGGRFTTGETGGGGSPGGGAETEDNGMRGVTPIPDGAESVDVVFPTPFIAPPVITGLTIQRPPGADAVLLDGLSAVNATGFTVDLSAPVSGAGYLLHWEAKLPTT